MLVVEGNPMATQNITPNKATFAKMAERSLYLSYPNVGVGRTVTAFEVGMKAAQIAKAEQTKEALANMGEGREERLAEKLSRLFHNFVTRFGA